MLNLKFVHLRGTILWQNPLTLDGYLNEISSLVGMDPLGALLDKNLEFVT